MERFLVALDNSESSSRVILYLIRVLAGTPHVRLILFHVLPTLSPDFLKRDDMRHIELMHAEHPGLRGYFWAREDESSMEQNFEEARHTLIHGGFSEAQLSTAFTVQSGEVAEILIKETRKHQCSTLVVGRRGLSRLKELFLGSVSKSVTKLARGITVWIVDT